MTCLRVLRTELLKLRRNHVLWVVALVDAAAPLMLVLLEALRAVSIALAGRSAPVGPHCPA
jgi:hypothetical protein